MGKSTGEIEDNDDELEEEDNENDIYGCSDEEQVYW